MVWLLQSGTVIWKLNPLPTLDTVILFYKNGGEGISKTPPLPGFSRVGKKGDSVSSPVNGNNNMCLTEWWRDLIVHAETLSKHWLPKLPRPTLGHAPSLSLDAQAQIPLQPRPSLAFTPQVRATSRPGSSRPGSRISNRSKVASLLRPHRQRERVAYVGSYLPFHVSRLVRKWRSLTYKMAASFVVVRNAERLSHFWETRWCDCSNWSASFW